MPIDFSPYRIRFTERLSSLVQNTVRTPARESASEHASLAEMPDVDTIHGWDGNRVIAWHRARGAEKAAHEIGVGQNPARVLRRYYTQAADHIDDAQIGNNDDGLTPAERLVKTEEALNLCQEATGAMDYVRRLYPGMSTAQVTEIRCKIENSATARSAIEKFYRPNAPMSFARSRPETNPLERTYGHLEELGSHAAGELGTESSAARPDAGRPVADTPTEVQAARDEFDRLLDFVPFLHPTQIADHMHRCAENIVRLPNEEQIPSLQRLVNVIEDIPTHGRAETPVRRAEVTYALEQALVRAGFAWPALTQPAARAEPISLRIIRNKYAFTAGKSSPNFVGEIFPDLLADFFGMLRGLTPPEREHEINDYLTWMHLALPSTSDANSGAYLRQLKHVFHEKLAQYYPDRTPSANSGVLSQSGIEERLSGHFAGHMRTIEQLAPNAQARANADFIENLEHGLDPAVQDAIRMQFGQALSLHESNRPRSTVEGELTQLRSRMTLTLRRDLRAAIDDYVAATRTLPADARDRELAEFQNFLVSHTYDTERQSAGLTYLVQSRAAENARSAVPAAPLSSRTDPRIAANHVSPETTNVLDVDEFLTQFPPLPPEPQGHFYTLLALQRQTGEERLSQLRPVDLPDFVQSYQAEFRNLPPTYQASEIARLQNLMDARVSDRGTYAWDPQIAALQALLT